MGTTNQTPSECKHCKHYVEMGQWYVSGRLEPYGKCMRRFDIYAKKPYGFDLDKLARVRWNDKCPDYQPKEKKDDENN